MAPEGACDSAAAAAMRAQHSGAADVRQTRTQAGEESTLCIYLRRYDGADVTKAVPFVAYAPVSASLRRVPSCRRRSAPVALGVSALGAAPRTARRAPRAVAPATAKSAPCDVAVRVATLRSQRCARRLSRNSCALAWTFAPLHTASHAVRAPVQMLRAAFRGVAMSASRAPAAKAVRQRTGLFGKRRRCQS